MKKPGVSVVVPVYNGASTLGACLDALGTQDYLGPRDVIVVDNGSTDDTPRLVVGHHSVRLLSCPRPGPAAARNAGIAAARYSLVALTDADCIPNRSWLTELVTGLEQDVAGVGGPLYSTSHGLINRTVAKLSFNQKKAATSSFPYLVTSNALFRREVLLNVGGFDERFEIAGGEDNDLGWRLHRMGYQIRFLPRALCLHKHAETLLDFVTQQLRYGYGESLLLSKYRHVSEMRDLLPQEDTSIAWRELCRSVGRRLTAWISDRDPHHVLLAVSDAAFFSGTLVAAWRKATKRWEAVEHTHPEVVPIGNSTPMCLKPWTSFELDDQHGNVLPCCWTKKIVGNVNRNTINEIWNGEGYQEFRRKMLANEYEDICPSDCPHRTGVLKEHLPVIGGSDVFRTNIELLHGDVAAQRTVLRAGPVSLRLLPSIRCNLECIMCWQRVEKDAELPPQFYDEVVAILPTMRSITLQGGEPLMIKRCRDLIASSSATQYPELELSLITNGTLLSDSFVKLIDGINVKWLFVSMDAATPETYRTIRGANFKDVCDGIRRVVHSRPDIEVILGFVVMRENVTEITAFIELANELGAQYEFSPLNAAFKKGNDFGDMDFRKRLAASIDEAESYISEIGLNNKSLESVKQRMWNEQFTWFRQTRPGKLAEDHERGRTLSAVQAKQL